MVYWPMFNINSIGNLNIGKGYQIKVTNPTVLTVSGDTLNYNYPININSGWSLLGYLHQEPYSIEEMLTPIDDVLIIAKNYLKRMEN